MRRGFGSGGAVLGAASNRLRFAPQIEALFQLESDAGGEITGFGMPEVSKAHPQQRALNLAHDVLGDWIVRDQGERNTCSAFCVAAVAELTDFHAAEIDTPPDYSEEYLYSKISQIGLEELIKGIKKEDIAYLVATGGRFLLQAREALRTGALISEDDFPYEPSRDEGETANIAAFTPTGFVRAPDAVSQMVDIDVKAGLQINEDRRWLSSADDAGDAIDDLAARFITLLQDKKPIAAGFPSLSNGDYDIWFGHKVIENGEVGYPSLPKLQEMGINGGHSVCIVGYNTNGFDPGDGVFIFRNSFGTRFASNPDTTSKWQPPAPGYGTIPFRDVRLCCLDYLHLA